MENQMEKVPELGLNSGLRALSPGHNHYTTQPTHIHTVHVRMWADPLFSWGERPQGGCSYGRGCSCGRRLQLWEGLQLWEEAAVVGGGCSYGRRLQLWEEAAVMGGGCSYGRGCSYAGGIRYTQLQDQLRPTQAPGGQSSIKDLLVSRPLTFGHLGLAVSCIATT